ncbi:hypothetical protein FRX31_024006, partial [Thalictrum thalictroides]
MILYEVLRLYPPTVRQIRYTVKKPKIGDITVSDEVAITKLQNIWGEYAEGFKPERQSCTPQISYLN